jgi:hypothetical protein
VDLGNVAGAGDTVALRWDLGTDGCAGRAGWYLDNLSVFSCTPKVPAVSIADAQLVEGDPLRREIVFTVLLSQPTIVPVSVTIETVDDTAVHGNDYDRVAGTVVIPASSATSLVGGAFVRIPVRDDIVAEGDESFRLIVTGVANATVTDGEAIGTIIDDDTTPPM